MRDAIINKIIFLVFTLFFSVDLIAQSVSDSSLAFPFYHSQSGGMFMNTPPNFTSTVVYDNLTNTYIVQQKIGDFDFGIPKIMSFLEYQDYIQNNLVNDYWQLRSNERATDQKSNFGLPKLYIPGKSFDRIFGGNAVDIRPQGSSELIFGVKINKVDNPSLPEEQRRTVSFDFQEKIQMNVVGKIGEKLKVTANFNTETTFDFENQMKVEYTGYEDEIIKKIELGNVSLPLNGTLITGSQSLFGLKTQLQFGRTTITGILSQQKSTKSEIEVSGGAQQSEFDIYADQYESNKHFFLAHYFKDQYDAALSSLPFINSTINITKIEVWVTNKTGSTNNTRNIVSFLDLGETNGNIYNTLFSSSNGGVFPDNNAANNMFTKLTNTYNDIRNINDVSNALQSTVLSNGTDFEKLERARKLTESEFTFNNQLGYISLNQALNNDEVLAVAYEYTVGSETYQVGELTTTGPTSPDALILKLLKGTNFTPSLPNWDLMMKNIYPIGAYQMSPDGFVLDVVYENTEESGALTNYLNERDEVNIHGKPLIKLLNLDRLNSQMDAQSDGVFDFIEGVTVKSSNGRIIFPVREPFGNYLASQFSDPTIAAKYSYQVLYDSTLTVAQQFPEKNKFRLKGTYESSSGAEIRLNAMNVPAGSVTVTAGSQKLVENQDYTVDYMLGRVTIINEGILTSGVPIKISLENNSMFGIQNKTLIGMHADYEINKDFLLGATMLRLSERPYTQKINSGQEPISNTIWGLDFNYQTQAPWLTTVIDKLPLIQTKEKSRLILTGEFAHLIPGHHKAVGEEGVSYIDDFESSKTSIDIKNMATWKLASIPQGQLNLFENANENNNLISGFKRAKLAWYTIDPLFFRNTSITPPNINQTLNLSNGNSVAQQSYHYSREVLETEVFPNKDPNLGSQIANLSVLDIAYYPQERGPYNYTINNVNNEGQLINPQSSWGGMMRKLETSDFEAANIEFVEFWMMDPFNPEDGLINHSGGDLYIHLGNMSEDVLKDGYKSFENGLPTSSKVEDVDTTAWGRVPTNFSIVDAFDNDPTSRLYQDVGLDGLRTQDERLFFDSVYIQALLNIYGESSPAYQKAINDPSSDNFHYFRGSDFDSRSTTILDRYKDFNNMEGNSVTTDNSPETYPTAATSQPNNEDLNGDHTLSETESYYQYKIRLDPDEMIVGQNYIADVLETTVKTENGANRSIKWYQYRVPIYQPDNVIGSIRDFKSIRFMRLAFSDFSQPIICRFATFDLIRGEWRRYNFSLEEPGEYVPIDNQDETTFDVSAVNIEENGNRNPIKYVLPPGIEQELDNTTTSQRQQNEQSLVLKVCNLKDGDARATYKTTDIDLRTYKRIKMFVHAEGEENNLDDDEISCFLRLGSDFTSNYYEYEILLKATEHGETNVNNIWPSENNIDVPFEIFQKVKQERNYTNSNALLPYVKYESGGKVTVVGNPNLAQVKTIMIGVRNPKKQSLEDPDDGLSKCGQIWVNELRLTEFDEKGGWAANSRVTARLADFGNITLSGSMSTIGFGSIEKKVNERQKHNAYQYDFSSTFNLGKFFPEDFGLKIPMYIGRSQAIKNPQYNPLDPDILFTESVKVLETKAEKDSLKNIVQDYVQRKSINFTNVRKVKVQKKGETPKKPKVYDIENFTISYSKNLTFIRNINTEYNRTVNYRGALTYNYNTQPKNIKPFSKIKFPKSAYFRLIKDFNFNTMPRSFSFRTDIDRNYNETKMRNLSNSNMIILPTYDKFFTWNRSYELKYDLMRNLKLDFAVNQRANIDEPAGILDKSDPLYRQKMDTIWNNFWNFGRVTHYHQTFGANYQAPLNKIPIINFTSLNIRYTANYDWTASLPAISYLGNTIQNSKSIQYNGQINLTTLYNKVPYFKKINQRNRTQSRSTIRNRTENKEDKEQKKNKFGFFRHMTSFVLGVKNIAVNYSENQGILLPGYLNQSKVFGQDWRRLSPGLPFAFGSQKDIRSRAAQNGWISKNSALNTMYKTTSSNNLTLRSNVEPIKQLKIELTANKTTSKNNTEYFRWDDEINNFNSFSPSESGSFSISFISLKTAFKRDNDDDESEVFNNFRNNRLIIAKQLAQNNPNFNGGLDPITGFPAEYIIYTGDTFQTLIGGYGETSQEVMIPAFLAAYAGSDPLNSKLTAFPSIPLPNWRITYDGFVRIPYIKKRFKQFTIGHAYRSTYTVGSYQSNLNYENGDEINMNNMSYHVAREISQVTINEQFSPLFKLDMTWKNSLLTKIEFKRSRILSLSLANNQLTETGSKEYVFGIGYRIQDVEFKIFSGGSGKKISSNLDLKLDFNLMNNKTVIRKIVEDVEQLTMGQQLIKIKFSADYVISQRLNIKAFYDKSITNPFISTTFPSAITNIGFSLRFTLAG
ncbi:MAG: cell surface protein SprA [Flavobacteriales bacterium]|nr:cell surface protein SprA [Flavobacteriales bacterium]